MNRNVFLTALIALFFSLNSFGQNYQLQVVVRDSASNKTMEDVVAEVISPGETSKSLHAGVSDVRGRIFFSLPAGNYRLVVRMLGYSPLIRDINMNGDKKLDFKLSPQPPSASIPHIRYPTV